MNAVLIAVGHVANIDPGGGEIDDVASGLTVLEQQVAQAAIAQGSGEVVLGGHGDGLENHGASGGAIGQKHLFGAADELAVHQGVAHVERYRLQTTGVGEQLEAGGVAVLEHDRGGLVGIGHGREGSVGRRVVNASEREIDRWNLTNSAVNGESSASTSNLMQNTINVVIDGCAAKGRAHRGVGDACGGDDRFAQAASLQGLAVARSGPGSTRAGQFNAEGALHPGVGQELL